MKRKIFSVLVALVLVASLGLVTVVPAAATDQTIVLGGDVATAIGAQASDEYYTGSGSWRSVLGTKMEHYIDPTVAPFDSLGTFTIDEIASISYWTNKPGSEGDVDFYLAIYTTPDNNDNTTDWYGYRLNAEPYFSQDLNAPVNEWNTWTTDDGTNQLTFFDTAKTGGYGSYNQPTLQDLQAGTINWHDYNSAYTDEEIDYGAETVKYITFQTGTGWMDTFDGYIDAITIELTTGDSLTIDLEQFYNEVWVDDDAGVEWYALPGNFEKIQDGIDNVAPSGTVNVEAGAYTEDILIDKALTVRSTDEAEETIIDGGGFRYVVKIYSSDVTFEGFTVTNPTYAGGSDATGILVGAYLGESVDNVHILNNIVKTVRSGTSGAPSMYGATGINVGRAPLSSVVISGNTIEDIHNPDGASVDHTCGINVWDGAENVEISNNTISDIKFNGILLECASNVQIVENSIAECKIGILVEPYEGVTVSGLTINHNTISEFRKGGIVVKDAPSVQIEDNNISTTVISAATNGIQVGYLVDDIVPASTGTTGTVNNNRISDCHWEGYDPEVETYEDEWTGSGILVIDTESALTISGNEVQSCDVGLDIEAGTPTLITNNDVHDNSYGFVLWNANPTISLNNIYQNALGGVYRALDGSLEGTLDATNNWWGSASGPTHVSNTYTVPAGDDQGDAVSDLVDFVPWLNAPYDTGVSFAPVTTTDPVDSFASIQAGVDASDLGGTVNVAAGTYREHIVITTSSLNLIGEDRETTIIDATQDSSWTVAKPGILIGEYPLDDGVHGVKVSGFTIRDAAMQEGGVPYEGDKYGVGPQALAGILIYNSSSNAIENNILDNNYWQIFVCAEWPAAGYTECMNNRIADNVIRDSENDGVYLYSDGGVFVENTEIVNNEISNAYGEQASGIEFWGWPEGGDTPTVSGTVIRGNNITSCTYGFRIRDEVSDVTGTLVRFNNFIGSTTYGVYNDVPSTIDATNNWWGTKAGGLIKQMVSGNVDYDPWIGAKAKDSKSQKTAEGDDTVNAKDKTDTDVVKKGKGKPTITVTEYTDNPGDGAPGGFSSAAGKYIDVHIDDTTDVTEIEIRNYYTLADIDGLREATLRLSWWNGTAWIECSDSGVTYPDGGPTYRGYVWAIIKEAGAIPSTIPTLDDLAGTPFMSMARPAPTGGGGGIRRAPPAGTTDVRGQVSDVGVFLSPVTAVSEDELCSLTILEDTVGLTEELEPLTEITMLIMDEPPPPPEDAHIIGLAYDFGPARATFDPPITLEYTYDPADLPELVYDEDIGEWVSFDEDYLVLAYYDEDIGEWVELEDCVVDTENKTITVPISHFTTFAIIARVPAAPPPALAPAAFTSSSLSISPLEVDIGETVSISFLVTNTGEEEGSYTLTLKIGGVVEETKEIALAGGASETVTFTTAKDKAGAYSVGVDGLTGLFTVKEAPPPPAPPPPVLPPPTLPPGVNWTILGPVLGVAVFLAIFLPIRLRRRRAG